MRRFAP
jgi:hypothetical protein